MPNLNYGYLKILLVLTLLSSSVEGISMACITGTKIQAEEGVYDFSPPTARLLAPRELVPHSLKGRIAKAQSRKKLTTQKESNVSCSENAMCATFETNTTLKDVSAWIGFSFKDSSGSYFIATRGQEATHLGNNVYATEKWDRQHFWINIGKNVVPFPIQPRFVGIDKESGSEWHVVDYLGYQKQDIDYSNYFENISQSSLVLLVNPETKKVEEYYLEYYDENDEYAGDYDIKIGDKIESYFLGFKKREDNEYYLFSIEDVTPITDSLTFDYKEQYPGKDFNCSDCGELDLSTIEFKYIFEAYGDDRSNFTEPKGIETKNNEANTSANSSSSSSKSVPISGFWMFFILSMLTAVVALKNDKK